jgi:hypothetical protein
MGVMGMIRYFTLIEDPIYLIYGLKFAGLTIFPVTGVYAHDTIIQFTDKKTLNQDYL